MLRGKVALVLGASPLAQGIALAASRNDAIVVLASLAEKEASEVVSQARQELKRDVLIYQKVLCFVS
jgi:NAD(P)-dependent dehydrogenase (short-subunit alcohol dehydrogenase family)